MKRNSLRVVINAPMSKVFEFTLNPKNTPLWLDFIVEETASESPARIGTIYRNRSKSGVWSEYKISEFRQNSWFVLSRLDEAYHVSYEFAEMRPGITELEYTEWVDKGVIESPFTQDVLQKLKEVVESLSR